ncbi:hypothetical protein [Streptomyces poriticola]|uniref:hypothetical protein n=1 Tax=Streptomyces poriticola TaxID=3120506 RepID=UPI002FCDFBA3
MMRIAFSSGMNDEELKAQAIQDPKQAELLIAIERSRASDKRKTMALLGTFGLAALIVVVAAALYVVHAAGDLRLPWSRIGTALGTVLSASGLAGLSWWVKRKLTAWRRGTPNPQPPPESRTEGDQNQVGTA